MIKACCGVRVTVKKPDEEVKGSELSMKRGVSFLEILQLGFCFQHWPISLLCKSMLGITANWVTLHNGSE